MAARALWLPALVALVTVLWLAWSAPHALGEWLRANGAAAERRLARRERPGGVKLLLTSDLFDTDDGGSLPEVLKEMVSETGWVGSGATAVWLRDGRAGWPDIYERFRTCDVPGMARLTSLGITRHVGLWINREDAPDGPMVLERDMLGNVSEVADLEAVKAAIDEAVVFYVVGGEPYKLLKQLRAAPGSDVWAHALARIHRGELVYLARSAGTIIAGSNVDVSGFRSAGTLSEARRYLGEPISWAGLGLVPGNFALRPHYTPGRMIGAESRNGQNRGNWSDDDFIEHVQDQHPGVMAVPIPDGDFLAVHQGEIKLRHAFPRGWRSSSI